MVMRLKAAKAPAMASKVWTARSHHAMAAHNVWLLHRRFGAHDAHAQGQGSPLACFPSRQTKFRSFIVPPATCQPESGPSFRSLWQESDAWWIPLRSRTASTIIPQVDLQKIFFLKKSTNQKTNKWKRARFSHM